MNISLNIFIIMILAALLASSNSYAQSCEFGDDDFTPKLSELGYRKSTNKVYCNVRKGSTVRATLLGTVTSTDPADKVNAQYTYRIVAADGQQTHNAGVIGNDTNGMNMSRPTELKNVNRFFVEVYVSLSFCDIAKSKRKSTCSIENPRLIIEQVSR